MAWQNVVIRYNNSAVTSAHLKQVTIATERDEENLNKNLILVDFPTATSNKADGKKDTKAMDLLRIQERVTIDGSLVTGLGTSGSFDVGYGLGSATYTEQTNASDKKTDLKAIFKGGGVEYMTYEGTTYRVHLEKISIQSENKEGYEPNDSEVGFSVKLTAIKADDF